MCIITVASYKGSVKFISSKKKELKSRHHFTRNNSMEPRFTRGEYWLLETVVEYQLRVCDLIMFRILPLFMATLLLFNMMPVCLAQQNDTQAIAKADASADMSNSSKADWFMLGVWGSTLGCFLGCAGGCLLGKLNQGHISGSIDATQANFALVGGTLLGVCAVPIAVFVYPHNVTPPPERLLGKSPEYIEAYTQAYKSRTTLLRKIFVTTGSITSNLAVMTLVLTTIVRFWGSLE